MQALSIENQARRISCHVSVSISLFGLGSGLTCSSCSRLRSPWAWHYMDAALTCMQMQMASTMCHPITFTEGSCAETPWSPMPHLTFAQPPEHLSPDLARLCLPVAVLLLQRLRLGVPPAQPLHPAWCQPQSPGAPRQQNSESSHSKPLDLSSCTAACKLLRTQLDMHQLADAF